MTLLNPSFNEWRFTERPVFSGKKCRPPYAQRTVSKMLRSRVTSHMMQCIANLKEKERIAKEEAEFNALPSVYEALEGHDLLKKVTGIVLSKASMPYHLREDAIQEIHMTWLSLKAKPEFKKGQLAQYATLSGQHAALRLRRSIGAVVTIPGTLFRAGQSSLFLESIGAAVNPYALEDLNEGEFSSEQDNPEHSVISPSTLASRLTPMVLTDKEHLIIQEVIAKQRCPKEVAKELGLKVQAMERLLLQLAERFEQYDADVKEATSQREGPCPSRMIPAASRASLRK